MAGENFVIIEYADLTCSVMPFANNYKKRDNIPIVKAVTAYDVEETGDMYILVLGQALYFRADVDASLLRPNQMRPMVWY